MHCLCQCCGSSIMTSHLAGWQLGVPGRHDWWPVSKATSHACLLALPETIAGGMVSGSDSAHKALLMLCAADGQPVSDMSALEVESHMRGPVGSSIVLTLGSRLNSSAPCFNADLSGQARKVHSTTYMDLIHALQSPVLTQDQCSTKTLSSQPAAQTFVPATVHSYGVHSTSE